MAIFYVVEGTIIKPTAEILTFSEYNPAVGQIYEQELSEIWEKYEVVGRADSGKTIIYKIYFKDLNHREQYQNVVESQVERIVYYTSVGVVITVTDLGYVDVPE